MQPYRLSPMCAYAAGVLDAALEGAGVPTAERAAIREQFARTWRDADENPATAATIFAQFQIEVKRTSSRAKQQSRQQGELTGSSSLAVAPDAASQPRKAKAARPSSGNGASDGSRAVVAAAPPPPASNCPSTTPLVHPAMKAAAVEPKSLSSRPECITLFCVYSGSGGQRAKAFVVDRQRPGFEGIMLSLEAKFKMPLSLGYVMVQTGEYVEVLDEDTLTRLIQQDHAASDTMTLYCWAKAKDGDASSSAGDALSRRSDSEPSQTPNKRAKSARPTSALSVTSANRSSAAGGGNARRHDPSNPMHVSGAFFTEDQLRDLFDELDTDGSGTLDRDEFRVYFTDKYDSLCGDVDKRFDKLMRESAPRGGGAVRLTFDQFCLVMLKVAQW